MINSAKPSNDVYALHAASIANWDFVFFLYQFKFITLNPEEALMQSLLAYATQQANETALQKLAEIGEPCSKMITNAYDGVLSPKPIHPRTDPQEHIDFMQKAYSEFRDPANPPFIAKLSKS